MKTEVKLKIADIIISLQSEFPLQWANKKEKIPRRFANFIYHGQCQPDIAIRVNIQKRLPSLFRARNLFITYHPEDNQENWRLLKKGSDYIFKSPLKDKKQVMLIDESLTKVSAYLLQGKNKKKAWHIEDIIYDFLQILLVSYFAKYKKGVFVHSVGVKDKKIQGLLFAGRSGTGKSTTARLWHNYSQALVLNDDRVIVRKNEGRFFIYGSPWHGDFSDYLNTRTESAPLKKLFFIRHARKNTALAIKPGQAFRLLYPVIFPAFWNKGWLENIISLSWDLVNSVHVLDLGFVNNKSVISYVRKLCGK